MFLPDGLILKESPIEGQGVFTIKEFPESYCFGPFIGIEMPIKEFHKAYGMNYIYCYRLGRTNKIISAKHDRNFITYINDGIHGQAVNKVNVVLKKRALYALRPIAPNEELLLDYGKLYHWQ